MSYWAQYGIEERVIQILSEVESHPTPHHFGQPFVTSYQLAIAFAARFPDVTQAIGFPIGGLHVGGRNSLAQYLARELSGRINRDENYPIEGSFLSRMSFKEMSFKDNNGNTITSSVADAGYDLAMFRLRTNRV